MYNGSNRNKQTYGKRRQARDRLIDSCFTSSSPSKAAKSIEIREDKVVELLQNLVLEDDHTVQPPTGVDQEETDTLKPRNANERKPCKPRSSTQKLETKKEKADHVSLPTIKDENSVPVPEIKSPSRPKHEEGQPEEPSREESILHSTIKTSSTPSSRPCRRRVRKPADPSPSIKRAIATPESITHARPLLTLCNDPHAQGGPLCFQSWADSLSDYFNITKIAEASYGEVYRLSLLPSVSTTFTKADESVLKVIALKAPPSEVPLTTRQKKRQAAMSVVDHVASEVRLLKRMSPVPGFTNFRDVRVVQGRLPRQFVAAWKHYDQNVKKSFFTDPSRKAAYEEEQLWAIVEMQNAGSDLESLLELPESDEDDHGETDPVHEQQWRQINIYAAWDIFWGIACTVAKGEAWAEFEHRDLHLGNICVHSKSSTPLLDVLTTSNTPQILTRKLNFTPLSTTIIDYTLSRAIMSTSASEDVAYLDLSADPALFAGDGNVEYQYEIYRYMRGEVLFTDPTITTAKPPKPAAQRRKPAGPRGKRAQNNAADAIEEQVKALSIENGKAAMPWKEYHSMTNLVWLHFILYNLMLAAEAPGDEDGAKSVAPTLYRRLQCLNEEKLALKNLKKRHWTSAADLVAWAVQQGWLDEEDVVGVGCQNDWP